MNFDIDTIAAARAAWNLRTQCVAGRSPLQALLAHAGAQVPFYRSLGAAWSELPIVDRADHIREAVAFRAGEARSSAFRLTSSGTTGVPLVVDLDDAAWYAVNFHFFEQVRALAALPADSFGTGQLAVVFVSNKPGRESFVRPLPSLNNALYARVQLSESPGTMRRLMSRLRAPVLYGKPSYLLDLRAALLADGLARSPWSPRLLLASGEPLYEDDRVRLERFFDAPIMDALASTEGGLIAAKAPGESAHRVLGDNVWLEVLDASGRSSTQGQGELLLTNLLFRDSVFIRYRTGDLAELATDANGRTQRLLRLFGRDPEHLQFASGRVAVEAIGRALMAVDGLADYQVCAGAGTTVRWTSDASDRSDDAAVLRALGARMQQLLPGEAIAYERFATLTPKGGKKRRFIQTSDTQPLGQQA